MQGVNDDELLDFVELTKTEPLDVRFIEYMPFEGNKWSKQKMFSYAQMQTVIKARHNSFQIFAAGRYVTPAPPYLTCALNPIRFSHSEANETSKAWHVPGYSGSIGFVTSMSDHFCSSW